MITQQGTSAAADKHSLRSWAGALRPHQWVKNLLVFVPVVTSHRWGQGEVVLRAALIFVSLSLCASALYIVNDLLDAASDRAHPRKRLRPFASGALPMPAGIAVSALLLAAGLTLAGLSSSGALAMASLYAGLSGLYSLRIKRHAPLDVFFLAGLYVLRILAGGVATRIHVTDWLLAFALFLFLGLAFCKRASELRAVSQPPGGRGYTPGDSELVTSCGIAASFIATLVLVLYLNSEQVRIMYRTPMTLWLLAPLILFWQVRLWMLTLRGEMDDDPVLFATRDGTTWIVGLVSLAVILVAM